ncbi:MAG: ABC transporter ATP-binding protein [Acidimicrobiales bacterium]
MSSESHPEIRPPAATGPALEVIRATVSYGDVVAVRDATLTIEPGKIVALLGPSGCGKSTLLRTIAGLQPLQTGQIKWSGQDQAHVAVHQRGFGLMFQENALFPHRNVADNIAFGLRMSGVGRRDRTARVEELLELVGLQGTGKRSTGTLSGGQLQRVALARALATEPGLLLLDEPLGSLDRALRDRLVHEIRSIIKELGITAIHVTHDHDEALSVADDLALMNDGVISRVGGAGELLSRPGDSATAEALGIDTVWQIVADEAGRASTPFGVVTLPSAAGEASILLRPEAVRVSSSGSAATVLSSRHRAGTWLVTAQLEVDHPRSLVFTHPSRMDPGTEVHLTADLGLVEFLEN